jgi:hypothetical protein
MELAQQVAELKTVILSLVLIGSMGMFVMYLLALQPQEKPKDTTPTYYCRKHGCPEAECADKHGDTE